VRHARVSYNFIHGKRTIYIHSINYVSQEKYKNDWENRCVVWLYPYALEWTWYHCRFWFSIASMFMVICNNCTLGLLSPPPLCSPSCGFSIFSFTSFWPFCTWVSMSIIESSDSMKTQSTTCIQFLFVFHSYYVRMWNSNSRIAPRNPQIATADREEI
jgi:hypothetical protein